MRQLTQFATLAEAERFAEVLFGDQIESTVEILRQGTFGVWVHDEARIADARALLDAFKASPDDPRFDEFIAQSKVLRAKVQREKTEDRSRPVKVRVRWQASTSISLVTLTLAVISVIVAVATSLGDRPEITSKLAFASYDIIGSHVRSNGISDLLRGEVWRLITPIFVHYGFMHIVFNLWWLKDLGTAIEQRQSSLLLLVMVTVIAIVSNSAQYVLTQSPLFGGMSGVVYGLFGYIWVRGRLDPASGYFMPPSVALWMIAWFVLCFTGLVGAVANGAHAAGLIVGAAWGYLSSGHIRRLLRGRS